MSFFLIRMNSYEMKNNDEIFSLDDCVFFSGGQGFEPGGNEYWRFTIFFIESQAANFLK